MKKDKMKKQTLDVMIETISFIRFMVFCMLLFSLLFTFIVRHEVVRGTSMYPQLKEGEHVLVNVVKTFTTDMKRFDVVVAKSHHSKDLWVKRVIGLPGEVIEYRDDVLYVDGKKVKEPFLDASYTKRIKKQRKLLDYTRNYKSKRLQDDEYLLLGDNRIDSLDSRSESVGPFKKNQIIANGVFVITPLSEMRYIGNGR